MYNKRVVSSSWQFNYAGVPCRCRSRSSLLTQIQCSGFSYGKLEKHNQLPKSRGDPQHRQKSLPGGPPAQDVTDGHFGLDSALPWHGPILRRPRRQIKRNSGRQAIRRSRRQGAPRSARTATSRKAENSVLHPSTWRSFEPVAGHLPAKAELPFRTPRRFAFTLCKRCADRSWSACAPAPLSHPPRALPGRGLPSLPLDSSHKTADRGCLPPK
jgi:hypothetical protein